MSDETGRFGPAIDLATEEDFMLGTLRVSPSIREIARGGLREMLEPRVMQVLVAFWHAQGRVVSRDEMIARCWEGRIVGEDAINRAIGRLRRLSEVDREASFSIETIPRVGYRLVPGSGRPVVPSGAEFRQTGVAAPAEVSEIGGLPFWRRPSVMAVGLAVLALAAGAGAWLLWPAPRWSVVGSRPFISSLALEDYPAFSPDGAMLAYTSAPTGGARQIYMRSLAGGEGIRITNDAFDDTTPTWSSDGAHLAYVASKPGEPCRIMVATIPGGETREAAHCLAAQSSALAWQPGSPFIYYIERAGLTGDTIFRLNLDTGAREPVVREPAVRDIISTPKCSPDGRWLVYLLRGQLIMLRDLSSGREKRLGDIVLRGDWQASLAWSADSRTVLASIAGGAAGSLIMGYPLNEGAPYQVYATATKIGHMAANGNLLALETDTTRTMLARAGPSPSAEPDILDRANGFTWSPTFAPDGTLAFLSNRSGTNAIWVMKPGAAPRILLDGGFTPLFRVRFSPDGTRLAVASETPEKVTVKIITAAGASLTSFDMPSLGLGLPSWTPDGKAVIVFDRHCLCTYRVPAENPARRSVFAGAHWTGIAARADGIFATRADPDGIWRIDRGPKQINSTYPKFYLPPMAFRGDDVLVPDYSTNPPRILAQPVSGGVAMAIAYAPGAQNQPWLQSDFAVNPKTGEIVYVAAVAQDTNIDLLTLRGR